jgi:hypothetical protein
MQKRVASRPERTVEEALQGAEAGVESPSVVREKRDVGKRIAAPRSRAAKAVIRRRRGRK